MNKPSTRFTPTVLREVLERTSLLDIVRERVALKRKGRDWWGCCPFHQEKSASFHVREHEGYYHCFGCGAHGNAYDFVMETKGMQFPEAVEMLAERAGIRLEREQRDPEVEKRRHDGYAALAKAAEWFYRNLKGSPAVPYIQKRQLQAETVKAFKLGWAPDAWRDLKDFLLNEGFALDLLREAGLVRQSDKGGEDYDAFRARLMFPIFDRRNRVVAFGGRVIGDGSPKYLNSSDTPFFNKSRTLYALNEAAPHVRREGELLLVEGYMDVVSLWQAGVKTAVAPLGTAVTAEQIELLWRHHDQPIVCLDGDNAGRAAARRAAERALEVLTTGKALRFLWLPEGHDPDSFVQEHGVTAFRDLLKTSVSHEDVLWQSVTEGHDLKSGAGRAAVDTAIFELGNRVKDERLRRYLTGALKDRLWQTIRGSSRIGVLAKKKEIASEEGAGSTTRVLMAILCKYPQLVLRVREEITRLDLTEAALQQLRRVIFRAHSENRLETEQFATYLNDTGMQQAVDKLLLSTGLDKVLTTHNLSDDLDELEAFWMNLYADIQRLRRQKRVSQAVLAEVGDDVVSDSEAWRRFCETRRKG